MFIFFLKAQVESEKKLSSFEAHISFKMPETS